MKLTKIAKKDLASERKKGKQDGYGAVARLHKIALGGHFFGGGG